MGSIGKNGSNGKNGKRKTVCAEAVQNEVEWCPKCSVVVPSVLDGKVRNASRRARPYNGTVLYWVSKIRVKGVQNV